MSRRRVRIYGLDYWPDTTGISVYTTAFAEHLAERGDEVDVVAGMPYYPEWRVRDGYARKLRMTEEHNGVTIHRRRQYIPRKQSALHRAGYEASFLAQSIVDRLPRPDLVIAVTPALSDGVLAACAAKRHGVPFTLWMQDLLGASALQSGVNGGQRIAKQVAGLEGWIAKQAEAVAIIAEGFRKPLEKLDVDPKRIHRVRNWTHINAPTMGAAETRDALRLPQDRIICMHAGNMGVKQGLENVIECARLAQVQAPELYFVLMGDGSQRSKLETIAQGLKNVLFLDPVDGHMFPNALHAADVLLINQLGSVVDMSLPSKLTSYLAVGRPVVAAAHPESETAAALQEATVGTIVPPDRPDLLTKAIANVGAATLNSESKSRHYPVSTFTLPRESESDRLSDVLRLAENR